MAAEQQIFQDSIFRKCQPWVYLGLSADFCENSKSGIGFKIGPTQPEKKITALWTFIADPAVSLAVFVLWVAWPSFSSSRLGHAVFVPQVARPTFSSSRVSPAVFVDLSNEPSSTSDWNFLRFFLVWISWLKI